MKPFPFSLLFMSTLFSAVFMMVLIPPGFASPVGGEITSGSGQIQTLDANTTLVTQETSTLAIDWQSLNLAVDETLRFEQPSSESMALNTIFDQQPTQIFGQIEANGRVFLMNPNGIIFGTTARINVGALIAGAFQLDFESLHDNGEFPFTTGTGLVENAGQIVTGEGGSVALIGQTVINSGEIRAQLGKIHLLSTGAATLSFDSDGLIQFSIQQEILENTLGSESAVLNSGVLQADGGYVLLEAHAANAVYSQVVNNEGIIQANRITNEGGVIRLEGVGGNVINSGTLSAIGVGDASGGEISLMGDRVGVFANAMIDASGNTGGGHIAIGGYRKGAGDNVSEFTQVVSDTQIRADAIEHGDGGEIIIWANDTSWAAGTVSATGGASSGNGGFVEISGKQGLVLTANVDLTASNGEFGTLLLDPTDITIHDQADGAQGNDGLLPDLSDATVGVGTFDIGELALEALSGTSNLVLEATNNIVLNDLADNELAFAINTGGSIVITADSDSNGVGSFSMNTGDTLSTQGSSLNITAAGITLGTLNTDGPAASDGAIFVTSSASIDMGSASSGGEDINVTIDNDNNGTETLTLRGSLTGNSVTLNGGTDGGDTLIGPDLVNAWTATSLNTGSLNGSIFLNFPNLTGGSNDDTFTVTGSITGQFDGGGHATGDTVDYSGVGVITSVTLNTDVVNIENLIGGAAVFSLIAEDVPNTWVLTSANAGSVAGVSFTDFSDLTGGSNTDDFILSGGSTTGTIRGSGGSDSLTANNTSNNWNILSTDSGNVGSVFAFTSIENLTGGNGADRFVFNSGATISGIIDGGAGDDSLGADDIANIWNITANDAGDVTGVGAFINMENLNGRNDTDRFIIGDGFSISGTIDGGGGVDSVDLSNQTLDVLVDLGASRYANIEQFTGSSIASTSTLVGADVVNIWSINGAFDGVDDGTVGLVTFINFTDLTGGTDNDSFSLSSGTLSGTVSGGGGNDTLIGDNAANTWNILTPDAGTATGVGAFSGIGNLTGNASTDDFIFADASSLSGVVNGSGNSDSVNFSAETGAVTVSMGSTGFANIETFIGNDNDSTLIGDNVVNTWLITGINDGTINTTIFTNFNNLTGGTDSDTFTLLSGIITGLINGGGSTDSLLGDNAANTWTLTAADTGTLSSIVGVTGFSSIEDLIGNFDTDDFVFTDPGTLSGTINGASGDDSLDYNAKIGAVTVDVADINFVSIETFIGNNTDSTLLADNVANTWNITGENDGTIGITTFVDFNNLTGNDNTDDFVLDTGGSITGSISGGLSNDTIQSVDTGATWNITAADVGNLTSVNAFSTIETLQGGNGADIFIFSDGATFSGVINGGLGSDEVDQSAQSGAVNINLATSSFSSIESFVGNNSDSTLLGANTNNTWTMSGANSGTVNSIAFAGFNNLTGNTQIDQFIISGGSLSGSLNGGAGSDTLTADNTVNVWNVLTSDSGNVTNVGSFSQIENLTGNNLADIFVFANGASISGNIDGAADNDTVDFSAEAGPLAIALGVSGFINIETFIGNNLDSTLTGPVGSNNWVITGNNDGMVGAIAFTNFNNLTGNSSSDNFQFQDGSIITGTIDGSAGLDTVDLSLESGVVTVNLESGAYSSIETFIGNNFSSTISGDNVANSWVISDVNDGTVGTVTFFDFNNLIGNNNTDDFSLNGGSITGSIDGGGGVDNISADNASNTWTIFSADAGSVSGISAFSNIENLTGNAGVDDFTFADGSSISGSVDGGTNIDSVNQSAQSGLVNIILSGTAYINIENFIGNGTNSTLTGADIVNSWVLSGADSGSVGPIIYTGFGNLQGGSNDDSFTISGGAVSGLIDGGLGNDQILAENITNTWNITGADIGNVTGINTFSSIETLLGNAGVDNFIFADGSSFSGVIDGADNADTVDYSSETGAVIASLATGQYLNIESFIGNVTNSTLVGDNTINAWLITGSDSGNVNGINFAGFNNVSGNASIDLFTLAGGSISGVIDGGTGNDSIQAESITNSWNVTSADGGDLTSVNAFQNIDNLLGGNATDTFNINANLSGTVDGGIGDDIFNLGGLINVGGGLVGAAGSDILNGPAQNSSWIISGADSGSVNGIGFSQIENLAGGAGDDTFNVSNAATAGISGGIAGGGGNDDLLIDYILASTRTLSFDGGSGTDSINLTGSGTGLTNSYVFGPASGAVAVNTIDGSNSQDIIGSGIEIVTDTLSADNIALVGSTGDDVIALSAGIISGSQPVSFQIFGMPALQFSNKTHLSIDAAAGADTITVTGSVALSGNIDITAETIIEAAGGELGADTLTLNQATAIGTALNPLGTSVNTLLINGPTIDAYINEANSLAVAVSNVSGTLSITTNAGDITSAGSLTVTGTSTFNVADGGSIILDNAANQFAGTPAFSSAGIINNLVLVDNSSVDLPTLSLSGNLSVSADGPVRQVGALTVQGNTTVISGSNLIDLGNAANDFVGTVSLQNSGAVNTTIVDSNALILAGSTVGSGTLSVTAADISQVGPLVQSANAGTAIFTATGGNISLTNGGNDFTGAVLLNNTGAGSTVLNDSDGLTLGASATNGGDLTITATNGITLTGTTTSANGDIAITANTGDIQLGRLDSGTGRLTINAVTGNVIGNNSSIIEPNLSSQNLEIFAGQTIGDFNNPISISVPSNGTSLFIAGEGAANIIGLTGTILPASVLVNDVTLSNLAVGKGQNVSRLEHSQSPPQEYFLSPLYSISNGGIHLFRYDIDTGQWNGMNGENPSEVPENR